MKKGSSLKPNLILKRVRESFSTEEILSQAGGQNLYDYLGNSNNELNLIQKGDICKQIAKSIQMLHHFKYVHRDIKPENFIKFGNDFQLTITID